MGLTPSKEAVLNRLNEEAKSDHEEATQKAIRAGKPPPPAPVPLQSEQVEFPKWLHKDWEPTDKAPGHHKPKESKLVHNPEDMKELVAKGWTEEPPKGGAKKEVAKEAQKELLKKE